MVDISNSQQLTPKLSRLIKGKIMCKRKNMHFLFWDELSLKTKIKFYRPKHSYNSETAAPPSMEQTIIFHYLVHSTYQQALSAQSCTSQCQQKPLWITGNFNPTNYVHLPISLGLLLCLHPTQYSYLMIQCSAHCNSNYKYMFRVVSKAHLVLSL